MRKFMKSIWEKSKNFCLWIWTECRNWQTIVLLAVVCLVLGFPVWAGYLFGFLFDWSWALWVATIAFGFWMLPGAPYFALCVSITLVIKKIHERSIKKKKREELLKSQKDMIVNLDRDDWFVVVFFEDVFLIEIRRTPCL